MTQKQIDRLKADRRHEAPPQTLLRELHSAIEDAEEAEYVAWLCGKILKYVSGSEIDVSLPDRLRPGQMTILNQDGVTLRIIALNDAGQVIYRHEGDQGAASNTPWRVGSLKEVAGS